MRVKIKRLHPDAVIPYKSHDTDFCYDCVAVSEEEVAPNVWKYGLGIALQIDRGDYDAYSTSSLSIDARPRSSVWRTGMVLSNCEGTIDEGYTGEITAYFYHVMPGMPRYRKGDRIIQIKLGDAERIRFVEVDELECTDRGEGGYGSTGR